MDTKSRWHNELQQKWLHPRRKRFWAMVLLLLYTLAGFFLAPLLVENGLTGFARDNLQREAIIEKVAVNPFVLSLSVQGFELRDPDGESVLRCDEFFANFQLSSLFRWAWTFREIRLDQPWFLYERFESGESRLGRLLRNYSEQQPPAEEAAPQDEGLPRLLVQAFLLNGGAGVIRDDVPARDFEAKVGPVDVAIVELSTLPDGYGRDTVTIVLPEGAVLTWVGETSLSPFHSRGSLALQGSRLHSTISYLESLLPLEQVNAVLNLNLNYSLRLEAGTPDFEVDGLFAELRDLQVIGLNPTEQFLEIPSLRLEGGSLRYPERTFQASSLSIDQARLIAWLDENGEPSLAQLLPAAADEPAASTAADAPAWQVAVASIEFSDGRMDLSDRSLAARPALDLRSFSLQIDEFSNRDGAQYPLQLSASLPEDSRIALDGELELFPAVNLEASLDTAGVPLSLTQAYVQQAARVTIRSGRLNSQLQLAVEDASLRSVRGNLTVEQLEIYDTDEDERLLGWLQLQLDGLAITPSEDRLEISELIFSEPFGRVVIFEDQSTNLSRLAVATDPERQENGSGDTQDESAFPQIVIGGIIVQQGALNFSDLSLPLPFSANIAELGGTVSTVSTVSEEPAQVALEGQVNRFGMASISGSLAPFDPLRNTDIQIDFRNLEMSNLSPYSVDFAGREIAGGKLDLNLGYTIMDGRLTGRNDIVLSDLVLGDKVEHPGAASLPLGLAVALLKDSNGVIDIELPVEGDVNDPKFRIGGLVWKAISSLITKVVTAPFRLLGSLIGVEGDELGQLQFRAGRADLSPPERGKVQQLLKALQQRPELAIEIPAAYAPEIDTPALRYQRLRDEVVRRMDEEPGATGTESFRFDVRVRQVLEQLFQERFPETPLDGIKAAHTAPPANDENGEAVLDELAYTHALRDRLLEAVPVTEADLAELGEERAAAVRSAFLESGEVAADRLLTTAPAEGEVQNGDWVLMELGVAPD